MAQSVGGTRRRAFPRRGGVRVALIAAVGLASSSGMAAAEQFNTGNPDLKIRWDKTLKYSTMFRLEQPSSRLITGTTDASGANYDDGDRNFKRGLVSNRVDLLSELDVSYRDIGFRVSGAGWYDTVYNRGTDNDSPSTYNAFSTSNGAFTKGTRTQYGRNVELLDAFVFGKVRIDDVGVSGRAGRHGLVWGESLFFGDNAIAGAMAPVDAAKGASVPNTQFKELIRPVNQISGQVQLTPTVSMGAYYQLEWRRVRLNGAGSYFSDADILDSGGERILAGSPPFPGAATPAFYRDADMKPRNSGQFGIQTRLQVPGDDTDVGLYVVRFHAKDPNIYLYPTGGYNAATGGIGTYRLVYAENIWAFGASFSKSIGSVNWAGEMSLRTNSPLASTPQVIAPGTSADNDSNPAYAVGKSLHGNLSALYTMAPNAIAAESSLVAEIAFNSRLAVDKNRAAIEPNSRVTAIGLRMVYEPVYRQILPGLDIGVPIGVGYNPAGRSSVLQSFGGAVDKGGDISLGINGTYLDAWRVGLNYTHYIGSAGVMRDNSNYRTYRQTLADRDFVSLSVRRTF